MAKESYIHRKEEGAPGAPLLFVFHGTGGDENQLMGLGRDLLPDATIISPRGDVSEHGAARFFRRTGEGVYDMDDLGRRTQAMAAFVRAHVEASDASRVIGLGYSNGANILAAAMFAAPELFEAAVFMHPLIPFQPKVDGDLSKARILITAGRTDPICPPNVTSLLESNLRNLKAHVDLVWHEGGHEVRQAEIAAANNFLMPYRAQEGAR
jgi:phospholipase/carboxylesterase